MQTTHNKIHLADDEHPDPHVRAPPLHQHVGDDPAHHGSDGAGHQRDPGHEAVDLVTSEAAVLEEQLRVIGPHVASGVPDASSYAEHQHARHDEGEDESEDAARQRQLLLFHLLLLTAVSLILLALGLSDSDDYDYGCYHSCGGMEDNGNKELSTVGSSQRFQDGCVTENNKL